MSWAEVVMLVVATNTLTFVATCLWFSRDIQDAYHDGWGEGRAFANTYPSEEE